MNVILAKSAGFCPGVKRAVDMVYEQSKKCEHTEPVYTYGPIIHNDEVVKDLESKGVRVIHECDDIHALPKGTVIIRSHGVSRTVQKSLEDAGFHVVDATCPFVKRIHNIVEEQGAEGRDILIIGDPKHPEVQGIVGWCQTPSTVIQTVEDAESFQIDATRKFCIISQTTFNYNKFKELVEIILRTAPIRSLPRSMWPRSTVTVTRLCPRPSLMLLLALPSPCWLTSPRMSPSTRV